MPRCSPKTGAPCDLRREAMADGTMVFHAQARRWVFPHDPFAHPLFPLPVLGWTHCPFCDEALTAPPGKELRPATPETPAPSFGEGSE